MILICIYINEKNFNDFKINDTIKNLKLAATLEKIMINGKDEFYKGETAKKLVKFINENGGIITMEDLEVYEAVWRDPVVFNYDDLKIISMSPPSSGGVCINQILKMMKLRKIMKMKLKLAQMEQVLIHQSQYLKNLQKK